GAEGREERRARGDPPRRWRRFGRRLDRCAGGGDYGHDRHRHADPDQVTSEAPWTPLQLRRSHSLCGLSAPPARRTDANYAPAPLSATEHADWSEFRESPRCPVPSSPRWWHGLVWTPRMQWTRAAGPLRR